jgi:hypothetical protein
MPGRGSRGRHMPTRLAVRGIPHVADFATADRHPVPFPRARGRGLGVGDFFLGVAAAQPVARTVTRRAPPRHPSGIPRRPAREYPSPAPSSEPPMPRHLHPEPNAQQPFPSVQTHCRASSLRVGRLALRHVAPHDTAFVHAWTTYDHVCPPPVHRTARCAAPGGGASSTVDAGSGSAPAAWERPAAASGPPSGPAAWRPAAVLAAASAGPAAASPTAGTD